MPARTAASVAALLAALSVGWGAALALAASSAAAQAPSLPEGAAVVRSTREARHAVERFERRRRSLLPISHVDPGRCDARVGRYCYWYDAAVDPGPAEPVKIGEARERLLALLDSLASMLPDDPWLAGQRVLYRLDGRDTSGAHRAAIACAAERWWCAALAGLALHRADRPAAADSAFTVALATMSTDVACRWRDIGVLLDDDARRRYRSRSCADRELVERRFWWLAAPLWSRPGNDARSEHLSRVVIGAIAEQGATPYGGRWSDDMSELLLRYGWPGRWSRRESGTGMSPEIVVVGHDASPAYQWPANARLLDSPYDATTADWTPRDPRARSRDAPLHARRLHDMEAAVSLLRRGDSLLAVAAVAVPAALDGRTNGGTEAALVLALDTAALTTARMPVTSQPSLLVDATVSDAPLLASIEVTGDSGQAARIRMAVRAPPLDRGFGISDLLLYRPTTDADTTMGSVRSAPVAGTIHPEQSPLGVYWELYGLDDGMAAVRTELLVLGDRPGWLERAWRTVRGTPRPAPVRLRWTDAVGGRGVRTRAVFISLEALPPGSYTVELRATAPDGRTATTRRVLQLAR